MAQREIGQPFDEVNGQATKRPIPFWEMRYILATNGFSIQRVGHNRLKVGDWLLTPVSLLFYLTNNLAYRAAKFFGCGSKASYVLETKETLNSWALLCDESFILEARRL
jgi:hypothetical protein